MRAARVQGDGAADDLVRALRAIVRVPELDVVIIGRGGGSAEDLWAFNDERLARAIAACPVPVISGVGHEVDFTIADFVADVRAATPSNAAELVVDRADNLSARIDRAERRLQCVPRSRGWTGGGSDAERLRHAARRSGRPRSSCASATAGTSSCGLRHAMRRSARARGPAIRRLRRRLERRDVRRVIAGPAHADRAAPTAGCASARPRCRLAAAARAGALSARLDALSPLAVLGRGYAVCWNDARTVSFGRRQPSRPGDRVRVTLAEGELACRVEQGS